MFVSDAAGIVAAQGIGGMRRGSASGATRIAGTTVDLRWRDLAACRGADTSLFFPESRSTDLREALAYCARCPVTEECLAEAHRYPMVKEGIWGGLSVNERKRLRRSRRLKSS
jgi:WhiB family redox-sensing transcriptional regulator